VARAEILAAARAVLESASAADFTVAAVMSRTTMTRKTFYVHFADRGELIRELIRPLRAELDVLIERWSASDDPVAGGSAALTEAARTYTTHATLLRAVWWSATDDTELERARAELAEPLSLVATRLLSERRGFAPDHARAVARVLALMNVHTLLTLGPSPTDQEVTSTIDALREVWISVILHDE
jgi:AcrR family transcriptional regulator